MRVRTVLTGFQGSPGLMTQYFQTSSANDAQTAQLAVDRVRDAITAGISMFPNIMTLAVQGQVDVLNEVTGDLTDSLNVTQRSLVGTGSGGFLPIATGLCIVWVTSEFVNSRRVIGKTYLVPLVLTGSTDSDGTPQAGLLVKAQAFADAMDNAGATNVNFIVWHRPVGGTGGSAHAVVGNRVSDKFAVLRSRRD